MSISADLEHARQRAIQAAPLDTNETLDEIRGLLTEIRDLLKGQKATGGQTPAMRRPPWETICGNAIPTYWECPGCGQALTGWDPKKGTKERAREHWQAGHFDEPAHSEPRKEPPKDRVFAAQLARGWVKLFWHEARGVWDALDGRGCVDRSEFTEWREIGK